MITRLVGHHGDDTCAAGVRVGETVYLAHHAGGFDSDDIATQTRSALADVDATMQRLGGSVTDLVQLTVYLREIEDLRVAADVVGEVFGDSPPARMTRTSDFLDPRCRVQVDGVAVLRR